MNPEIEKYIKQAQDKGLSDNQIRNNLLDAGWDANSVNKGLGGGAEISVPKPVTATSKDEYKHLSNPLNSILYFISFMVLFTAIYSGVVVSNNAIEYYLPKETMQSPIYGGGIATASEVVYQTTTVAFAFFVISLPIYLGIHSFLKMEEGKKEIIRKSWSRKISYFLIILNCFVVCLGAPVWLVWLIVTQDFVVNDLLKFFVNFTLNFLPLTYYFLQLRDDKKIFG